VEWGWGQCQFLFLASRRSTAIGAFGEKHAPSWALPVGKRGSKGSLDHDFDSEKKDSLGRGSLRKEGAPKNNKGKRERGECRRENSGRGSRFGTKRPVGNLRWTVAPKGGKVLQPTNRASFLSTRRKKEKETGNTESKTPSSLLRAR